MLDWNDLRYFLAVADHGSTLRAGRELRTSQTTVARRIAALEAATGFPLFDRRQAGYALTPVGESLLERARAVAGAAARFEEAAAASARETGGIVRLTTEDIFADALLSPMLVDLYERHPEIRIELDSSRSLRDLGAGEADIALRSTSKSAPAGIVGRRICDDDWTFYCSRDYAQRHGGVPHSKAELRQHSLVGGGGGNLWRAYEAILEEFGLREQVTIQQGTSTGLLTGIRAGMGIGVLPCVIADGESDLVRCMPPKTGHGRVMWLLTHERVRHTPAVRLVIDFLYERLKKRVGELNLAA
ncbi:LysR family transcriptional regulator [Sphingomonas edaphi]|uniref:LysR family transcriptional regulator n=1 Tax=Sphingomonas edaphi TaxID=2315689 RepID=A0A418PYJ4_9SPHN|nr:LysR family transcriptional regulator [Sphingomonas edaphi]RIX27231.1 LysR family transcriptional regulator [Sphingomonas edaphi]